MSVLESPSIAQPELIQKQLWVVRVFNNEHNTYDEVISILLLATGCDAHEAYLETWEIDHLGSSVVHHGGEEECRRAGQTIATIGIRVEVSEE